MNLQSFSYGEGVLYLAVVALVYIGLTMIVEDTVGRAIVGGMGIVCVVGVGRFVERYAQ
jgi:predicted tellurium resistance membrane protein TerC